MKFWRATRASAGTLAFGTAVALDVPVGGSLPRINGNELWYSLNIAPNQLELHLTTLNNGALAGAPQVVTSLNSEKDELGAVLTLQGLRVYFASNRSFSKGFDIWTATRPSTKDDFLPATLVTELNSLNDDYPNWVSPDDCWMLLCSQNASTSDIYVARRPAAPTR